MAGLACMAGLNLSFDEALDEMYYPDPLGGPQQCGTGGGEAIVTSLVPPERRLDMTCVDDYSKGG